jgi:hypothetical protein
MLRFAQHDIEVFARIATQSLGRGKGEGRDGQEGFTLTSVLSQRERK